MKLRDLFFVVSTISVATVIIILSLDRITPYVTVKEAMSSEGTVQIIGRSVQGIPVIVPEISSFYIEDINTDKLLVVVNSVLPLNFTSSGKIAVRGIYDRRRELFVAERLMMKCPSKYTEKGKTE